ncbi:hypothetical protein PVAND_016824 [Polypedilum vanderplanki]|uniref:Uncharacterized protein n=1 Tax=Polypedilum vanderplanki TaxID=319348 RepID=A0A9J6BH53_POLVA|nr:hypothetical protein PVAND_016824 [Polypedilum vanderplanki]
MVLQLKPSAETGLEYLKYLIYLGFLKSKSTKKIKKFVKANIPLLNFLDFVIEQISSDVDELQKQIEENQQEISSRFDHLEKFLERSFATLSKEIKINELTRLQSKMTTAFDDFVNIIAAYGENEKELEYHLEKFIEEYRREKLETNVVNYLRQKTFGTESALKQIYDSFILDTENYFNSKKTSPNLLMLDFYKSLAFMVYRGNFLLSYCYNLKDSIQNKNSMSDQKYIELQTKETIENLKTAFQELISEDDNKYLSTYIDLSPASNKSKGNYEKDFVETWWDRMFPQVIDIYVYIRAIMAEKEGFVITGIKLCTQHFKNIGKVFYFKIQIGKFLKNGTIDKSTVYWQNDPDDLRDKRNLVICDELIMDDLSFENSVLTGVQFLAKNLEMHNGTIYGRCIAIGDKRVLVHNTYGLRIYGRQFIIDGLGKERRLQNSNENEKFEELVSSKDEENLKQSDIENPQTYKVSRGNFLVRIIEHIRAHNYNNNIHNMPRTKISFITEEIKLDAPVPLSGLGLLHFTNNKNFAGPSVDTRKKLVKIAKDCKGCRMFTAE